MMTNNNNKGNNMLNFDKMRYCSLLSAVAVMVISLCAAAWYSMCNMDVTDQSARFMVRNYFIDVWFCLLLAFLAFENLVIQLQVH